MAASAPPDGKKLIKLVEGNICQEHHWKPAVFYCNSCSKLICNDCLLANHKSCVNDMCTIDVALKDETGKVERYIRELDKEIKELRRKLLTTGPEKNGISTRQQEGEKALLREKASLEAKLDEDLAAQMKKLNDNHQKKKDALQQEYDEKKRILATSCEAREKERLKAEGDLTKCVTGKEESLKAFQETKAYDSLVEMKKAVEKAIARKHGQIPTSIPSAADITIPVITSSQYYGLDVEVVEKRTGHEPKQEPVTFKGGEDLGEFDSCLLLYARLMTSTHERIVGLERYCKGEVFSNVRAVPKDDEVWSIIEKIGLVKRLGLTIEKKDAVTGDWHQITKARTELRQQLASSKGHEPKQEPVTFKGGEDLGEFDSCLLLYARLMTDGNYGLGGPWVREETHQPGGNANVFLSSRAPNDAEENFHGVVKHWKRSSTHERIGGLERYCKGKVRRAVETVSRRAPDLAILVVDHSIAMRGTQAAIDRELGNIEMELDIEACPRHCDVCGTGFGYPDPDYLFRVEDELKAIGVDD